MMLRASREAQPTSRRVRSGFVDKLALEDKQLGTLLIGDDAQVCPGLPTFEAHQVREAGLLVERLVCNDRNRARLPGELVGVDDDVAAFAARELPQLDEQDAARLRKRCMAKALRIQEKRAGRPVPVFVGEHALEHENLLSLGMIVRRKPRAWLVAHDRRNLARLRRTHQVDSLSPNRPARTRRPFHPGRVGHGPDGEIPVDRGDAHSSLLIKRYTAIRIPNPTYIPTNATSISIVTPKLIISAADRKIIVPARPANEMAMPATTFSVLCLGTGLCGLSRRLTVMSVPASGEIPTNGGQVK